MSDSENTKGHGGSVPEEDPERAADQHSAQGGPQDDLTVDEILDTPQSDEASNADGGASEDSDSSSESHRLAEERLEDLRRLQAEFLNFKNRTAREKDQLKDHVSAGLMSALLPVFDDIDAARQAGDLTDGPFASIASKLEDALSRNGLKRVGRVGEQFDPNIHEAVLQQPTDEVEPDHVSMVLRSGFTMGDRVVRAAQVAVATKP